MAWRVARSLETLRNQVNVAYPRRNRRSDGTIGDTNHSKRTSDHNPWVPPPHGGVVTALDLTHDPASGADMHRLAEAIKDDPRVKYVIWNRRIWNPSVAHRWRYYGGSNPHTSHMHVSVRSTSAAYDSTAPWRLSEVSTAGTTPEPVPIEEEHMWKIVQESGTHSLWAVSPAKTIHVSPSLLRAMQSAGLIANKAPWPPMDRAHIDALRR